MLYPQSLGDQGFSKEIKVPEFGLYILEKTLVFARGHPKGKIVLRCMTVYFGILSDGLMSESSDSQTLKHLRSP